MDQRQYVEVMNDVVMPWIKKTYGDKDIVYCFQQVCLTFPSFTLDLLKLRFDNMKIGSLI